MILFFSKRGNLPKRLNNMKEKNKQKKKHTHTHTKGQFGGEAGGLGLWLGKSSGNVLGATLSVCVCV